jgi:hypothetical protein
MKGLLEKLLEAVVFGKVDKKSPYPPHQRDQEGAFELAKLAIEEGIKPDEILETALVPAMANVGDKFSRK